MSFTTHYTKLLIASIFLLRGAEGIKDGINLQISYFLNLRASVAGTFA